MKNILYNTGYFFKETFVMVRMSWLSNTLSLFSTGLIFFILAMVLSGWWISSGVAGAIGEQAEISVYYNSNADGNGASKLLDSIKGISGVRTARLIDEKEAYSRMEKILGKESEILKVFDDNPFTSYIEINIDLVSIDSILDALKKMPGVEYIRDNRDILDRMASITRLFMLVGYLVLAAAGISTLVIISHIIRLAIQDNREQINTLKLLGAPGAFIALPFLLQGLLITLGGGIAASLLTALTLRQVYGQITGPLPFIPLPPIGSVVSGMLCVIMAAAAALGLIGSVLGLSSSGRR